MFSGLLPVVVLMICMLVAAYWVAKREGYPRRPDGSDRLDPFAGWHAVFLSFIAAVPGMFVVAIVWFSLWIPSLLKGAPVC